MRLRSLTALLALLSIVLLVGVVVPGVLRFVHMFGAHPGPALTQEEIEAAYNSTRGEKTRPQRIPKIIHQIFHNWKDPGNESIPSDWDEVRATCKTHNPDFEHRLWTESASREFIAENYPWFLKTYDGYKFPVQRIDSLRYFLILKFGGIYLDLDNGCSRDLLPLLYYPSFLIDGGKGTLSNNIIGARPGHPFWQLIVDSLIPWSFYYILPYFTIHYASGQWFVTAIWNKYFSRMPADVDEEDNIYRVMMDMGEGGARWVFFTQGRGGSWDNWDNYFFSYIGNVMVPWIVRNVLWFPVVGAVVFGGLYWLRGRSVRGMKGYKVVADMA
ncbi:nucleotide-diphospho-sugar transferase [Immersiella caudata]|uniref:Nucleotide-diphospho-sugar transferase n=1 Tax=Immersiella caudata TaxID=314043 RepID=A0AA39X614_9PEZI|nr:nucleotide-diphospho-sugar transferase [Immersiella caudata]